jgi:hypothetical protein
MIVIPRTPNSVYIPVVQSEHSFFLVDIMFNVDVLAGCMKVEFDSTYPVHLNGIISQNEFEESIHKINRTISSNKSLMVLGAIFLLSIIGGTILFIVGGVTQINSSRYGFPAFYAAGVALTTFGSIFIGIGCCIVQFRRVNRMRQAVVEESRKYSSRSPTPCSWRLDTSTTYTGYYRNQHGQNLAYHVRINTMSFQRSYKDTCLLFVLVSD